MVEINVTYEGQLRCKAIHGPSECELSTDAPVDNHGRGESFSPTDLVATALATCVSTIMGIYADRHQIDLTGMSVHVEKHMSPEPPRRISRLPVVIKVPTMVEQKHREALELAAAHCPVHESLHPDIDAPLTFIYPEA